MIPSQHNNFPKKSFKNKNNNKKTLSFVKL